MKAKYIIGSVIIVLFLAWGTSAFFKTTIQYVSLDDARASARTVQVMGSIDFDRVNYNADERRLEFAIFDAEDNAVEPLSVVYYGVVPGNFDQATSVVLKGKSDGGTFVADQMLVKCPSKYQGEDGGDGYRDMNEHSEAVSAGV